ncbi:MAG: FHA domain-containing protein [Pseudomonadota bacterium]
MKFIRDLLTRSKTSEAKASTEAASEETEAEETELSATLHADLPKEANITLVAEDEPSEPEAAEAAPAIEPQPEAAAVVETEAAAPEEEASAEEEDTSDSDILKKINADFDPATSSKEAAVNIWDLDEGDSAEAVEDKPKQRRRRRNQTRVLGFIAEEDNVVSAFDAAEQVAPSVRPKFPVGWVIVTEGLGRGECFSLEAGMSQIGRGQDQTIQLDFGDNAISRVNHAAIVYDQETHSFILGHGGKKNIVRLNGKPVVSNEELATNDEIKVGETTLRFVALCTTEFNWADQEDPSEEQDHVAIA